MTVGAANIRDLPEELFSEVVDLWRVTGLTRPWNDPNEDLRRAIEGPASTVLVAQSDSGALLGTAMVGHDGHRGWVYYVAVRPVWQGRGIGRLLMASCEAWLRDRGVPKVQLMVRRENSAVLEFYGALGYEPSDVEVLGRRLDE